MKALLFFARQSRTTTVIACLTGAVAALGTTGLVVLIHAIVSGSRRPSPSPTTFALLCGAVLLNTVAAQIALVRVVQRSAVELRVGIARRMLASPLRDLERIGSARLLAVLTDDVATLSTSLNVLPGLFTNAIVGLACFAYLGWLSWKLLAYAIGFIVIGVASYGFIASAGERALCDVRRSQDVVFERLRAFTEGTKELLLHRKRRQFAVSELESAAEQCRTHSLTAYTLLTTGATWGSLLFFAAIGLLVYLGMNVEGVTRETLSGYTLTTLFLMSPMTMVVNVVPVLAKADVALRAIDALGLPLPITRDEDADSAPAALPIQRLEVRGVTHSYTCANNRADAFALGPVDLSIRAGEVVFVIGSNGSGKSTLAKIVAGLYAPMVGRLYLDGVLIADHNRDWYRQHFCAIFPDFCLVEDLRSTGGPDAELRAQTYLARLGLERVVEIRNGRLSTTELSQGQRKRLALLTAYLEDRPIYVFDEWAADQDPTFKKVFYTELVPELRARGKAVLLITHDDRFLYCADRIVKLEDGAIVPPQCPGPQTDKNASIGAQNGSRARQPALQDPRLA